MVSALAGLAAVKPMGVLITSAVEPEATGWNSATALTVSAVNETGVLIVPTEGVELLSVTFNAKPVRMTWKV